MKKLALSKKQLIKFTLIGIFSVIIDLIFYYTFLNILPETSFFFITKEEISKAMSFLCGLGKRKIVQKEELQNSL